MTCTINLFKGLISTMALAVLAWPAVGQNNKPTGNAPQVEIGSVSAQPSSGNNHSTRIEWAVKAPAGVEIKGFTIELVATYEDGSTEKRQRTLGADARKAGFEVPSAHVVIKQLSNNSARTTRSNGENKDKNNKDKQTRNLGTIGPDLPAIPTIQGTPAQASGSSSTFEVKTFAFQVQTKFRTTDLARVTGKFTPAPDFATSLKLNGGGQSGAPANLRVNQLVLRKVARPEPGCQPNGCLELSFGAQPTPGTTLSESKITLILRLKDNSRLEASKSVNAATTSARFSLDSFRSTGAPSSARLPLATEDVLRLLSSADVQIENKVTIETAVAVNKSK